MDMGTSFKHNGFKCYCAEVGYRDHNPIIASSFTTINKKRRGRPSKARKPSYKAETILYDVQPVRDKDWSPRKVYVSDPHDGPHPSGASELCCPYCGSDSINIYGGAPTVDSSAEIDPESTMDLSGSKRDFFNNLDAHLDDEVDPNVLSYLSDIGAEDLVSELYPSREPKRDIEMYERHDEWRKDINSYKRELLYEIKQDKILAQMKWALGLE
jgi:hypothetical protein